MPTRQMYKHIEKYYCAYINLFVSNVPFLYPLKTSVMFSWGRERVQRERMGLRTTPGSKSFLIFLQNVMVIKQIDNHW